MIPEKITIGGHEMSIKYEETCLLEPKYVGRIDMSQNTIMLQKNIAESYTEEVLIHEIIHGFFEATGIEEMIDDNKKNELYVQSLTNIFWRFLKDNTNFFECK